MSTALTTEKAFQEKMMERIRASVGDLIPDAALAKLVDESVRKAFFEPAVKNFDYSGRPVYEGESWFIKFVRSEIHGVVADAVKEWLAKNNGEIRSKVYEYIDVGMVAALTNGINRLFSEPLREFGQRMEERIYKLENG